MRKILQSRTFERQIKKITKIDIKKIDETVRENYAGSGKRRPEKGELSRSLYHDMQHRLAYRFNSEVIELLSFGPRENFYR